MGDNKSAQQPDVNEQIKVRMEKLKNLQDAGKDPFQITKYDVTHHTDEIRAIYEAHEKELLGDRPAVNTEGLDEQQAREAVTADYNERRAIMDASPINVSFAGRMMFKRVMGKASFCNIADLKGRMQAYISRDAIGEEAYADFKKSDIGDIFGIKGFIFRTKTGEISVHAEEITLLSKSLQVLPEKFHGITDTDMRYRQRYVDLIMNPEVKETFVKRSKIIKEIRKFLDGREFMEVETPTLVSNAGGAAARPFETHYNALDEDVKLRISLELYLKRLIVGGLERVYEIGRVYRNEGVDTRHNPEFTLMELYQAYTDYEGMMELTESMFRHLAENVCGTTKITYNGTEIDLGKPFRRLTMNDAIKEYAGVDFDTIKTDEEAKALAKERGIEFEERHTKGDIINLFFEEYCEEKLIQPTFIMDHPLIQHKVNYIRRKEVGSKEFREIVGEIAALMCYEATRDLKLQDVEIQTPICKMTAKELAGKKLAVVPILRAGLGMVEGMLAMIPVAKVGHIGLFRDPETLEPVEYYCKLPADCEEREVFVVDPMLATGGSCIAAIQMLKNRGVKNIRFMCIIAAPEGVKKLQEAHPDVEVYIGALDEKLNEHGYIVPGLGDAGDRIFGTK